MTDTRQAINYWRERDKAESFWFEAQTGLIRDNPPAATNFYQYHLPGSIRGTVEAAVERATLGSGGLEYEPGFILKLDTWEKMLDR